MGPTECILVIYLHGIEVRLAGGWNIRDDRANGISLGEVGTDIDESARLAVALVTDPFQLVARILIPHACLS